MNTKVPFSDIHNNNRDINFCNCTNESTITSNSAFPLLPLQRAAGSQCSIN
ncbi:hypothetical protein ALC57_16921 [Trachymyrmex cornetzi]|uniref:Uncharacterized protein n=1 Tax=Trachymyrmex cornetzi TaxID=471704 RepID=A0A151ITY6_9HYME|nr:hypothetical protein ALC57_16921 [Trachymyrmex cornetzi]